MNPDDQRVPCEAGQGRLTRRGFLGRALAGAAAAGLPRLAFADAPAGGGKPPNFVIIFTDDQGYQDLGCFGSPDIATCRLDRMASEGMRFTDFYSAAPVCTPSRAALLTGCYPMRVGLPSVLHPSAKVGIHADEVTLAELLKTRGYATCCIGKWHLGHLPAFLPTRHGFDSYFGIPYSNDMRPTPLMRNETTIEQPANQDTLTERYTAEAVKFINESADKPFFLYLPHSMPHVPLHVSRRFRGKSKRGLYGDVIECIDWSTGQILDALTARGLDRRTLVVFTSDNGPWLSKGRHGGSAKPLRNGKGTTWEGGMREPCVMRWTGTIPAGKVCSELATTMDLYPTFAALGGARPPTDRTIDGKDITPLMTGQPGAKTPHEAFFYYSRRRLEAVRSGKWKLRPHTGRKKKGDKAEGAGAALYDLSADVGERNNMAADNPQVVRRLLDLMTKCRADIGSSARPCGRT